MCFYFGNGKGQVRLIALWDMFRDNTAVQCMLFAKVFQVFYAYIFCIQHTVYTLLVCYSKHMGSSLASLPYRQQVIYYLLKIHIRINLNSSTVHSYFELVCPFRDIGEATGPIFQTQSQERSVFMISVDALLPSALLWKLCETSHGFLSHSIDVLIFYQTNLSFFGGKCSMEQVQSLLLFYLQSMQK